MMFRFQERSSTIIQAGMWLTPVAWPASCAWPKTTYGRRLVDEALAGRVDDELARILALGDEADQRAVDATASSASTTRRPSGRAAAPSASPGAMPSPSFVAAPRLQSVSIPGW